MKGEGGYTLPEMLVVLLIIGTMFALALPSMVRLHNRTELDSAARGLAADLRGAEMSAYAHQDVHEVWFSSLTPQYTLLENGQFRSLYRFPKGVKYSGGYLEQSVSLLRFAPGSASGSGTVRLTGSGREQATVRVFVTTGHVIYEGIQR
jgi:prepilin-type N-terminal cleavage/methylation domain-containing protein